MTDDNNQQARRGGGNDRMKNLFAVVMLAAAAIAAAAAVYMVTRPVDTSPGVSDAPPVDESEMRVAVAEDMIRAGNFPDAVKMLRSYVEDHPDAVKPRLMLAECCIRMRKWKECLQHVDVVLSAVPGQPQALWYKGECYEQQNRGDGAKYFRRAADHPEAGEKIWGMYGLFMLDEGHYAAAEKYLLKARETGSRSGLVYTGLGKIALRQGRLKEALRYLGLAVEIRPGSGDVWCTLADVQIRLDKTDQAIASLEKAEKLTSGITRGMVLRQLGRLHTGRGDWHAAAESFGAASDYPPERGEAALEAAKCYYFADKPGGHELGKAMQYIDIAAALIPDHEDVAAWKEKIENARYGPPQPAGDDGGSFMDFSPELE